MAITTLRLQRNRRTMSMKRIVVRASLFLSMVTSGVLVGITGFTIYSWEMKDRAILLGLEKSGWTDLHLFTAVALALVLIFHLIENRRVIPAYVRTTLGRA
jgi:cytochrome b subunit of formate dehydrogenase